MSVKVEIHNINGIKTHKIKSHTTFYNINSPNWTIISTHTNHITPTAIYLNPSRKNRKRQFSNDKLNLFPMYMQIIIKYHDIN